MVYCIDGQVDEFAHGEVERDVTLAATFIGDSLGLIVIVWSFIVQVKTMFSVMARCNETNGVINILVGVALQIDIEIGCV